VLTDRCVGASVVICFRRVDGPLVPVGLRERDQLDLGSQNCLSLTTAQSTEQARDRIRTVDALPRTHSRCQATSSTHFNVRSVPTNGPLPDMTSLPPG
jgi:hypothetical protein